MAVSISQEDRAVIDDLYQSLLAFKQGLLKLSLLIIVELKKYAFNFIVSLGEFSPKEIREHGLESILMKRALRFFGFTDKDDEIQDHSKPKAKKWTLKRLAKRVLHVILSPIYLIVLFCLYIRNNRKGKSYVKNRYKT